MDKGATSNPKLAAALFGLVLLVAGCASRPFQPEPVSNPRDAHCLWLLHYMDELARSHRVEDAQAARISGFPHLRVDRFLASFADPSLSADAAAHWLEMARRLDEGARRAEAANLPTPARERLNRQIPPDETLQGVIQRCGGELVQRDLEFPERRRHLLSVARVPDSYQTWKRALGLYPITRHIGAFGLSRLHGRLAQSFRQPLSELPVQGRLLRYAPPPGPSLSPTEIAEILDSARNNPLGVPLPPRRQMESLWHTFAPVWEIDTRNRHDKIGTVALGTGGTPRINTVEPVVYRHHGFTRYHGDVLLQLIYQIWLPAREKSSPLDLYGGKLDSVIWRVTLGRDGRPVASDSIHACGCYYLLFPGPEYRAQPPKDGAEPILAPLTVPAIGPEKRLVIRLQSVTHYIQQLYAAPRGDTEKVYAWLETDRLRSLPMANGERRSLFAVDGLVPKSRRNERFLLWPFGIPSPGAMRQWGTHAIAFIGRRHFDEPFLLEKMVVLD